MLKKTTLLCVFCLYTLLLSALSNITYKDSFDKSPLFAKIEKANSLKRFYHISKIDALKYAPKLNSINTQNYNWGVIFSDVIYLTNKVDDHEPFDIAELIGSAYTNNSPLVSVEATLDDSYFTADLNPPLYSKYPLGGTYRFENRDENILGSPPKYALPMLSEYITNLEYEVNEHMLKTTFPFRYNLGLAYKADWVDLHSQIVNNQIDGLIPSGSPMLNFLDADYLFMRYGFYNITLNYNLPGNIKGTSTTYKFKNPNKFR